MAYLPILQIFYNILYLLFSLSHNLKTYGLSFTYLPTYGSFIYLYINGITCASNKEIGMIKLKNHIIVREIGRYMV